jgi:hypothetical protein
LGMGTGGEHALLSAFTAMRAGAAAQMELADKTIEMIETVTRFADETALDALTAGPGH